MHSISWASVKHLLRIITCVLTPSGLEDLYGEKAARHNMNFPRDGWEIRKCGWID